MDTTAEFWAVADEVRNWGRWGSDDQLGTLNLINEDKVKQAASLVRRGRLFALGTDIRGDGLYAGNARRRNPIHVMTIAGSDLTGMAEHLSAWPGRGTAEASIAAAFAGPARFTDDMIIMPTHTASHWDALSHVYYDDQLYNGYAGGTVTAMAATKASIDQTDVKGIASRGVLLDIARHRGVAYLPEGSSIGPDELAEVCKRQRVTLEPGDILLIRTGWWTRFPVLGERWIQNQPGLSWRTAPWLHAHGVAAVAADNAAVETLVPEIDGIPMAPLHMLCLRDMGMLFGENWNLEALAADCADDGVYVFQLVAPPLRIVGGVGSPINPLAMK